MKKLLLLVAALACSFPALAQTYKGDFILGDTITKVYDAYALTGADVERTAAGTASCVVDGGTTEITAGVTDSGLSEFDGVVGLNLLTVAATSGNGFAAGHDYDCGERATTLNGVTTTYQIVSFSIENRSASRNRIKDRGALVSGSNLTVLNLGAKISANDVWNGMLFRDLTTNETGVICDTINNGSTDTINVAGLNTTPGSTDAYQIIADGAPFSCVPFPKVDANGHVYVGYLGTSGSSEPPISDQAGANINTYFDNGAAAITSATVQGTHSASVSADTKLGTISDLGNGATVAGNLVDLVTASRMFTGTADSGTKVTLVDAALTQADTDYWARNAAIVFTSGTISGQVACVTKFNPGTDTLTFTPPVTQNVLTNTYVLIPAPGCAPH